MLPYLNKNLLTPLGTIKNSPHHLQTLEIIIENPLPGLVGDTGTGWQCIQIILYVYTIRYSPPPCPFPQRG